MAPRVRDGDGHETVVSNLLDLQARLRGDPGSLVLPREGRRVDLVSIDAGELTVATDAGGDPQRRIDALRRKLEFLELEIDAYEQVAHEPPPAATEPVPEADVTGLQHAVEERLAED
jgi:hypothetical protein